MRSGQRERPHAPKRPQRHRQDREPKRHQDARVVAVRGDNGRVAAHTHLLWRDAFEFIVHVEKRTPLLQRGDKDTP
eukprot:scaffold72025_cov72-Phaeocystis_antarctica.AAC.2